MHAPRLHAIEPLEPRIAPANLVVNLAGTRATWTDVDGDLVTLTSSKPVLDETDFHFLTPGPDDLGFQLAWLDLSTDFATGAALTFSARRDPIAKVGDGYVNVGWINALNSNLASITVPGDLARLDVGDQDRVTPAVGKITVHSAGIFGSRTQGDPVNGASPNVDWLVFGRLGALTVKGDFAANLNVQGASTNPGVGGSTGPITIWGDLAANDPALTALAESGAGYVFSSGPMGAVRVLGDLLGGSSLFSGSILSNSSIASVYVGGTVSGGTGDASGRIFADGAIPSVFVGGSLISGQSHDDNGSTVPANQAGAIGSKTRLGKVTVMGGVFGGGSYFGGSIFTQPGTGGSIGAVSINGILTGSTEIVGTGQNATLVFNGIYSDSTLGAVKIGSISGRNPSSPVNIVAKGERNPANPTEALAIASVTVLRGVSAAQILAGFDSALAPVNPDVQIGAVKVGNNWQSSSIAAGVSPGAGDIFFGNANDNVTVTQPSDPYQDSTAIRARIASVTIGGTVLGTTFATDSYAFEAQEIGAVKIGATVIPMSGPLGLADDYLFGVTHDFHIREL